MGFGSALIRLEPFLDLTNVVYGYFLLLHIDADESLQCLNLSIFGLDAFNMFFLHFISFLYYLGHLTFLALHFCIDILLEKENLLSQKSHLIL